MLINKRVVSLHPIVGGQVSLRVSGKNVGWCSDWRACCSAHVRLDCEECEPKQCSVAGLLCQSQFVHNIMETSGEGQSGLQLLPPEELLPFQEMFGDTKSRMDHVLVAIVGG